jgi:hypothetical protein
MLAVARVTWDGILGGDGRKLAAETTRGWMDRSRPAAAESNATAARQVPLGKDAVDSHGRGRAGPQPRAPLLDSTSCACPLALAFHD